MHPWNGRGLAAVQRTLNSIHCQLERSRLGLRANLTRLTIVIRLESFSAKTEMGDKSKSGTQIRIFKFCLLVNSSSGRP